MPQPIPRIVKPPINGHGFGRIPKLPDTRDWHAPALLSRLAPARARPRVNHEWTPGERLDQQATPECVSFTGLHLLMCGPILNRKHLPAHHDLYTLCQQLDEWPGESYEGTSSRGLMKALQQLGYVTGYAYASDVPTIVDWTLYVSPVCMGTLWTNGMFDPLVYQNESWLNVPEGPIDPNEVAGGHEWLIFGAHVNKRCPDGSKGAVRMLNSWSTSWGDDGSALLSLKALQSLLLADGDAVMPTEIRKPLTAKAA